MIQYIVILLDDTSTSFCHYTNGKTVRRLMPLATLKEGIRYAMKENLNIQFVYPAYSLPQEYLEVIDSIDHTDIKPFVNNEASLPGINEENVVSNDANVVVFNSLKEACGCQFGSGTAYVVRTDKASLFNGYKDIAEMLAETTRLNIVITDIAAFTDDDQVTYKSLLSQLSKEVERLYVIGKSPQLNLLTDRMMLDKMNNCGAGDTTITLAPDGCFYVCPAFYVSADGYAVGSLEHGLDIKNPQLYRLDHAPICRNCDAWQCRRCVWLNRKLTYEVNTPSHEQCVVAHLERNASSNLLSSIRKHGTFLPGKEDFKETEYLDPFDKRDDWRNV